MSTDSLRMPKYFSIKSGVHDGSGNAHGDAAHGQIALAPHRGHRKARLGKPQQLFLHVLGNLGLVLVLHVVAVNAEGGQSLLGVSRQHRRQIHRAGAARCR